MSRKHRLTASFRLHAMLIGIVGDVWNRVTRETLGNNGKNSVLQYNYKSHIHISKIRNDQSENDHLE